MHDAFPATGISEAGDAFHEIVPYSDDCVRLLHDDCRASSHSRADEKFFMILSWIDHVAGLQ
jgi:hypothetical protein